MRGRGDVVNNIAEIRGGFILVKEKYRKDKGKIEKAKGTGNEQLYQQPLS